MRSTHEPQRRRGAGRPPDPRHRNHFRPRRRTHPLHRVHPPHDSPRTGRPGPRERGFTLIGLIVFVAVVNIALGAIVATWTFVDQRVDENELIWRGQQYVRALECYQREQSRLPTELEDLLDAGCIRRLYPDPMTESGEWRVIRAGDLQDLEEGDGILGGGPRRAPRPGRADSRGAGIDADSGAGTGLSLGRGLGDEGDAGSDLGGTLDLGDGLELGEDRAQGREGRSRAEGRTRARRRERGDRRRRAGAQNRRRPATLRRQPGSSSEFQVDAIVGVVSRSTERPIREVERRGGSADLPAGGSGREGGATDPTGDGRASGVGGRSGGDGRTMESYAEWRFLVGGRGFQPSGRLRSARPSLLPAPPGSEDRGRSRESGVDIGSGLRGGEMDSVLGEEE